MTAKGSNRARGLDIKRSFNIVASVFLLVLFIKNSELASTEVFSALRTCAVMLIPSLFPLTVASHIATETGAIDALTKGLRAPIAKLFGVSEQAASPFFLGLVGGYTSSLSSATALYKGGKISKRDCESIIALSNMPSLAFLCGFVGGGLFKSSTIGWILWGITVFSSIILGMINRFLPRPKSSTQVYAASTQAQKGFSEILVDSISKSARSMITICACVVFFSVLIAVLRFSLSLLPLPEVARVLILGSLEITKGVSLCSALDGNTARLMTCAFFIGWSGLCVHFQVISLCNDADLSFKKYFLFKALQGVICAIITLLFFACFPELMPYK